MTEKSNVALARQKVNELLSRENRRIRQMKGCGPQWRYFSPEQVKDLRIQYAEKFRDDLTDVLLLLYQER